MEPRFPQLLRTYRHRWWKPLLGLSFACLLLLVMAIPIVLASMGVAAVTESGGAPLSDEGPDPGSPLGLLTNNLVIALLTPAALVTALVVHQQRPGFLSSVTGRLRVSLLARLSLIALVFSLTSFFLTVSLIPAEDDDGSTAPGTTTLVALLAVILLTTPLQAAGEEYGFRGYLTQALASWFSRPGAAAVVPGVVTAVVFALAHGVQDPWLFSDRLVFGLVASWLAWRTGGLEAPIALHVANNLVALTFASVTGELETALTSTSVDWRYAVADIVSLLLFGALVEWLARRWKVAVVSDARVVGYPGERLETPAAAGS